MEIHRERTEDGYIPIKQVGLTDENIVAILISGCMIRDTVQYCCIIAS